MNLKNGFLAMMIFACPMASVADGIDTKAVIGGGLGGALGAAVGSGLGGRNGAIIGGALGGGAGAAIATYDGWSGNDEAEPASKPAKVVYVRESPEVIVVREPSEVIYVREPGPPGRRQGHYKHRKGHKWK